MRRNQFFGILMSILISKAIANNLQLGDLGSAVTWVYLCGLTDDFNSPQEMENRQILDRVGKRKGIRFLALHPFERCPKAGNKLCWAHYTPEQARDTFKQISEATKNITAAGYIGFSNGGFFLNEIAQLQELGTPIISIGAAGTCHATDYSNKLTLIVGKEESVYTNALDLIKQAQGSNLSFHLIEHAGDHILPEHELEQALSK